jgi:hypothetical protein
MSFKINVRFKCEQCGRSPFYDTMVSLVGESPSDMRIDLTSASLPEGWWIGTANVQGSESRSSPEVRCACPQHIEIVRRGL